MSKQPVQTNKKGGIKQVANPTRLQTSQPVLAKQQVTERVVVKEIRREASAHSQAYAGFLVAPYDSECLVDAPSVVPVRRTTVRQNIVVDLAQNNQDGRFYLEVRPNLTDTLSITTASSDPLDTGNYLANLNYDALTAEESYPSDGELAHTSTGNSGTMSTVTGNMVAKKAFTLASTGAVTAWHYWLTIPALAAPAAITFKIYSNVGTGAWNSVTTFTVVCSEDGAIVNGDLALPALTSAITMSASVAATDPTTSVACNCSLILMYSSGAGTLGLATNFLVQDSLGLPLAQSIRDLESWCVAAQDVLVTFEGDTLNDGGNIASARVPRNWTTNGDPYSEILALPYDRYDGPLKHGTHVHWIPGSVTDLSPVITPADAAAYGAYKIVITGTITHPGASVRVRVCTAVSYYSGDPSYGTMDWAPPPTDYLLLLQYVARAVPAATANDTHILKKLPQLAQKYVKQGFRYLLENPDQLAKLAALIAASI